MMSRMTEKKQFENIIGFWQKKAPQGPKDDKELQRLNKSDNQGIRFMLITLYAQSGNEMKALKP